MRGLRPGWGNAGRVRCARGSGTASSPSTAGDSGTGAHDSAGTGSHGCSSSGYAGGHLGSGCSEHTADGDFSTSGCGHRPRTANRRADDRTGGDCASGSDHGGSGNGGACYSATSTRHGYASAGSHGHSSPDGRSRDRRR